MILLRLPEVHDCLTHWIYRSSQLCSESNIEQLLILEDVVQSLLNMHLCDGHFLILTEPHTNQIKSRGPIEKTSHL